MNFGFSGEMIFLFLLVLILFGPKKMPEIGRQIGRFLNEFRRASYEFRSQIESEINSLDGGGSPRQQILPPLQAPLGSLANRIFNPPPAEKPVEKPPEKPPEKPEAAEHAATENAAAVETGLAPSPEPSPAPKAAPDA
jgi:sec-independent protein translocase protein TatB